MKKEDFEMDNPIIAWIVFYAGMCAFVFGVVALTDAGYGKLGVFLVVGFTVWWLWMGNSGGSGGDGGRDGSNY